MSEILKAYWPYIAPSLGYLLINLGNMLTGRGKDPSLPREMASRISFTTSSDLPATQLKMPGTKEASK